MCVLCKAFGHVTASCVEKECSSEEMQYNPGKKISEDKRQHNENDRLQANNVSYGKRNKQTKGEVHEKNKKVWTRVTKKKSEVKAHEDACMQQEGNTTQVSTNAKHANSPSQPPNVQQVSTRVPKQANSRDKATTSNMFEVLSTIDEECEEDVYVQNDASNKTGPLREIFDEASQIAAMVEPITAHKDVNNQQAQHTTPVPTIDHTYVSTEEQIPSLSATLDQCTMSTEPPLQTETCDVVHVHTDTHTLLSIGAHSLFSSPTKTQTKLSTSYSKQSASFKATRNKGKKVIKTKFPNSNKNKQRTNLGAFNPSDNDSSLPPNIIHEQPTTSIEVRDIHPKRKPPHPHDASYSSLDY